MEAVVKRTVTPDHVEVTRANRMSAVRIRKPRVFRSAYDVAVSRGFPFINGQGRAIGNVWYTRFTKEQDGSGPALFVGLDHKVDRWLIEQE